MIPPNPPVRKAIPRPSEKDWFTPTPTLDGVKFRPYTYGIKPLMAQVTPYFRTDHPSYPGSELLQHQEPPSDEKKDPHAPNQLDLIHAFLYLHAGDLDTVLAETENPAAFRLAVKRFTLSFTSVGMARAIDWANRVIELDEASQVQIHAKPTRPEESKGDKPPKNS